MTITINYINEGSGIEIIASGCVTGDEIIEAHKEIYSSDNLTKQRYQIIDRTECIEYLVSNEDARKIAEIDKAASIVNANIIIAIISKTDLQFGVSRVWQAYLEDSTFVTQVFRDRIKAENWLKEQLNN